MKMLLKSPYRCNKNTYKEKQENDGIWRSGKLPRAGGGMVGYFRGWVRVGSMLGGGYVWSRFYLLVWGPTVIAYYFLKEITN